MGQGVLKERGWIAKLLFRLFSATVADVLGKVRGKKQQLAIQGVGRTLPGSPVAVCFNALYPRKQG